jgi:hypothetical protein
VRAGDLLRSAELSGCGRKVGLKPDGQRAAQLQSHGLEVLRGHAEALPFPGRSFEVVVLEYVAHHLQDLARARPARAKLNCSSLEARRWLEPVGKARSRRSKKRSSGRASAEAPRGTARIRIATGRRPRAWSGSWRGRRPGRSASIP